MLKFVADCLKTKKICKYAVKKLSFLIRLKKCEIKIIQKMVEH